MPIASFPSACDSRLSSLVHALGLTGSTSLTYGLGYDANSQITSLTTPDGTSSLAYDNNGQLTGASLTSESYSYDANGNRTSGGTTATTDNQLASNSIYTYSYDKNGNLTGKVRKDGTGSTLYAWDYRNRLTDVTFKDGSGNVTSSVHYAYDANNNRISKTVKDGSDNVILAEYSVYDGGNLLLVLDGSGNVKNRYLNGPNENQVLAEETNISGNGAGTTHWALTDHEGSVRDVVGNSGTVLDHIEYDSFGNVLSQTNSANAIRLGYTGQQFDAETGLYYDHARYYDPASGRFLSTDPSGFTAGDANLYRYVGNSPLDNTDPTGLCADGTNAQADQNGAMTEARVNQIVAQAKADLAISSGTATADDLRVRRDEAVSEGMSQQQADAAIAPLVTQASAQANQQAEDARYAAGDLTASEKLQGSGSILANTFTGGISDEAGWTQSNRYQEGGFGAARIAASAARDATIGLITAGAGSWVSAGGAIGDTAMAVNYAGRGYIAYQSGSTIGNGVNDISDGNYVRGTGEVLLGGLGVAGTLTGPLVPKAAVPATPAAPFEFGSGPVEYSGGSAMPGESVPVPPGMSSGPLETSPTPSGISAGTLDIPTGNLPTGDQSAIADTLNHIDAGTRPTGALAKRWGSTFYNNDGDLPGNAGAGGYQEYRVQPPPGVAGAGARRIVTGNSDGSVYYTWTHYGDAGDPAFVKIR